MNGRAATPASRRRAVGAAVGALLAWLAAGTVTAAKVDVYALVGGKAVTVSGPTIENATVVMRDGVIEAVGARITPPPDARVIDVKGMTLTPGLIDAFGGTGLPKPSSSANALSPQAMALDTVRAKDALKARDMGVTTALAVLRNGVTPGQSVLLNLSGSTPDEMAFLQPAAMHLHMAGRSSTYPRSTMGVMAYARQQLLDAGHYRAEWRAYEKAPRGRKRPRYQAELAPWGDVLAGKLTLIVTAPRENDIRRAVALADEFKIRVAVADARRAFKVLELVKSRGLPLLVSVNFDPARTGSPHRDQEKEKRLIDEAQRNPAELHKAGVPFALCSGWAPKFLSGVRKAIAAGLPREAALRALTLDAARALGIADRTGSLEAGKLANVVAWAGIPLDKKAKVKMVFVDGQLYEPVARPKKKSGEDEEEEKPETGFSAATEAVR